MYDEERKKPSIDILPDECLFEVLRCLSGGCERSSSACVSKRWLMLLSSIRNSEFCKSKNSDVSSSSGAASGDVEMTSAEEDIEVECNGCLTRSLEGKKATDIRLAAISVGTSTRGGLGKLSIRGSNTVRGITDLGLSAIARTCHSLKALTLWNVPAVGDEGLLELARECHSLEKLDLSQCPLISDRGLAAIAKSSLNLTSVSFESCSNIGNESLRAIGKYCHKLQSVTIKDCPRVGDQGIANLVSLATNVLARVKLQALNITDFSLAVLGHYGKAITNLVLSGLPKVSQKGFWVMGNAEGLQSLISLEITSCRGVTDRSLEAVGKGCSNLKQMRLHKCCFVSDNGLVAFTKNVKSVESILLEECNRISQTGILNALSNCTSKLKLLTPDRCMGIKDLPSESQYLSPCESLRSLSIKSCPGFGSSSLAMVGKLCPRLHQLDLTGLSGISDDSLVSVFESSKAGLVKLDLSDCVNLTDEVVSSLVARHGETLEVLSLDGCRKVTDAGLVSLANNCPMLNDLDMSRCLMD
ncbi:hypothetical protein LIER_34889 [Lithospermum erythrorhizon]|uniref:F-box/LRR-repeat protein 15-like leucin rich repeat domain-containing protein n=1 Tax=Lithospermum erythrorhizon TaxID=34254 RepID=A0AAV3S4M0_LITER